MKFGRAEDISQVTFNYPHKPTVYSGVEDSVLLFVKTGAPAWGDKGFIGKLYPKGSRTNEFLKYYAMHFDAIELNTTFYRIPPIDTLKKWSAMVPSEFKFCPKFPQQLSRASRLNPTSALLQDFLHMIDFLGEKHGLSFLQLPEHFSIQRKNELIDYLSSLPVQFRFAVEFRHPSWFTDQELMYQVFSKLAESNISTVITDTALRRDVLHLSLTTDTVMIRFTGNALHPTDFKRIDFWTRQIRAWQVQKVLQGIFFFIHQPQEHLCADLAVYFSDVISTTSELNVSRPRIFEGLF
ncbi:MAG: DUF72 domain-containing protein [Cyclobacteriaceae bacterium]|nr:DUF72 domain-containing protein [Cyclobacteriaceae bacterium]